MGGMGSLGLFDYRIRIPIHSETLLDSLSKLNGILAANLSHRKQKLIQAGFTKYGSGFRFVNRMHFFTES